MSIAKEILKQKRQELLAQVAEIRKDIREIEAALEVLGGETRTVAGTIYTGNANFSLLPAGASPINNAIIDAISQGNTTPAAIFDFITEQRQIDTSKNSVSTRLSKMKNDGLIDNDGQGWTVVKKAEGSGAEAPEPSNHPALGPVGRERGYPPSAPEGSNPSGSTASLSLSDAIDAVRHRSPEPDDEIPF
ncbi:hypothetical protein LB542_04725 [Mesorhizobium sp. BR1-1-9]|uniref:hypothetical protein n=1 Tax=unclassified Mesorhizobium TaxID=325217 RepID=UPI001CD10E39|nr:MULTISPECIES: hypothetical protein [unclassified Mesorhizobium]MBZ9870167.1 hypothetical protein [Mesorhizobium sp. BR1-1-9]MBZ9943956.1 hypothetical protein [Mesorhizobium sp. BR1-1-13]